MILQSVEEMSPQEVEVAEAALTLLESEECSLSCDDRSIPLRGYFLELLKQAMREAREGHAVSVLSNEAELTTQQAADLLQISRPFLVRLLKKGELAYEMRGTHHRVKLSELLRYKEQRSRKRREGLQAMSELAEEYGLPD